MSTEKAVPKKDSSVFAISMAATLAVVAWGIASPATFEKASNGLFAILIKNFG